MTSGSRHAGGGTLFTEPFLLVGQRAGTPGGIGVRDQHGRLLGTVVEADHGTFRKMLRMLTGSARFRPNCFAVRDSGGSVVLKVRAREARFLVTRADGTPIGEIAPDGPDRFAISAHGRPVGALENRHARDLTITDASGAEVARAADRGAGHHVVEVFAQLTDPLASLVIAAALTLDTAFRPG